MKTIKAFIIFCAVLFPAFASAQILNAEFGDSTVPILLSADMLSYDREHSIYTAEGNVEITRGAMILKADRVTMNGVTKEAEAAGNVYFFNGADEIKSDRFTLNIDTQTGIVYKGMIFYADKHFYITGDELEKFGDKSYRIRGGSLTSCDGDVPAWKISGSRSEMTLEGYAKIWNGAFRIKNFPVLYIPYGIFPVKTQRQSGFLFPMFGASDRKGFRFKESYFWAINRSMDATFSADVMTERGVMGGVEYRYFLKDDLKGNINYTFLDDAGYTYTDGTESERGFRWGLTAHHRQTLPGDIQLLADINLVSDDEYLEDFSDNINVKTARYLESRVSLLREWYSSALLLDASWFDDLNSISDKTTVQRLPRLTYYVRPFSIFGTPLAFEMSPSLVNYTREEGIEGLRLNLNPRLTANLTNGYFSVNPWVQGDMSWWWLDGDNTYSSEMDRLTYTAGVEMSTYLSKTYASRSDKYSSIIHVIKPVVGYWYSPEITGDEYPAFDAKDRIQSGSMLYVALINRLLGKGRTADGASLVDELLYLEIGAGVDFEPDIAWLGYQVDDPHFISNFEVRFSPFDHVSVRGKGRYDHDIDRFLTLSTDMTFTDNRGDALSFGYIEQSDYIYPEPYEQAFGSLKLVVSKSLDCSLYARYAFDVDDFRYLSCQVDYHRQCWGVDFTVYTNRYQDSNEPDEVGFFVSVTLSGLGTIPRIDLGSTKY